MILRIFLIFGDLSLDDTYKIHSYKKMCVIEFNHYIGDTHEVGHCSVVHKN